MQSERRLALTLTLSPRRGNHQLSLWKNQQLLNILQRRKKFSLSLGERAGVRAGVNSN